MKKFLSNKKQPITQEVLKERYYYKDGLLFYIKNDKRATSFAPKSYRAYNKVCLFDELYKNASFIFLFHHGYIPQIIDHIDNDRLNDRIENLRPATYSQNNANKTKSKGTLFKYMGIVRRTLNNTYYAMLQKDKIVYRNKVCRTVEQAAPEYNKLAVKHHGEFASLNIIQS